MDKHDIAAHKIADAFDTIAAEFANLPDEERKALAVAFSLTELSLSNSFSILAGMHRRKHPFEPVSEDEKQTLFEQVYEEMCDMPPKDHAWAYMEMEDWQMRAEIDDRAEYLKEEDGE